MAGVYTQEEFTDLYHRQMNMVYHICLMLMKNVPDAEDVTQTVFRKALELDEPFRNAEHERAWFIVASRNECKNQLKHWWRTRRAGVEELKAITWEQPGDGEVWELLLTLPERERMALYLHYYQGYDTNETAGLMGVKPATLRSWLYRARGKLKQRREAEGHGK